ncbi:hypothetical protein [Microbacterium elymi]|uniref:aromatic-ring hydroxylase C-terminal domain-containing protein n=1 Tax=Microbacterium elymi TaxID=2909587 RepID=UPI003F492BC3
METSKLYIQPSGAPGARLPHAWVTVDGRTVSTLDLVRPEGFTLLARVRGREWVDAATAVADELGVPLTALRVGPGADVADVYRDVAARLGIGEAGAVLVRPDQHVAWRSAGAAEDPRATLRDALTQVLAR